QEAWEPVRGSNRLLCGASVFDPADRSPGRLACPKFTRRPQKSEQSGESNRWFNSDLGSNHGGFLEIEFWNSKCSLEETQKFFGNAVWNRAGRTRIQPQIDKIRHRSTDNFRRSDGVLTDFDRGQDM